MIGRYVLFVKRGDFLEVRVYDEFKPFELARQKLTDGVGEELKGFDIGEQGFSRYMDSLGTSKPFLVDSYSFWDKHDRDALEVVGGFVRDAMPHVGPYLQGDGYAAVNYSYKKATDVLNAFLGYCSK